MNSGVNLFLALIFSAIFVLNTDITANPITNIDTVTIQLKWKHQFQFALRSSFSATHAQITIFTYFFTLIGFGLFVKSKINKLEKKRR